MDFSGTIVVYDLKLATKVRSNKKFMLTSKFCPLGSVCPLPRGYIYLLNHEKMYKIRLQRDFFETYNIWVKWLGLSVEIHFLSPGDVCPCPGAIYMYLIMKKCIKSDFKDRFLKLATNE